VPGADDWLLSDIQLTFSLVMGGFIWGGLFSNKLEQWGVRASSLLGAVGLGTGFSLAAAAAATESLPLLYAAGTLWGLGNGFAYTGPATMLMQWFPEKKGFASGACLVGFGGGGMIAAPLFTSLLSQNRVAPEYLGSVDTVPLINYHGKLVAADSSTEVVVATAADIKAWDGLVEGVYAVGTGATGVVPTFLVMGAGYSLVMMLASTQYRYPPPKFGLTSTATSTVKVDPALVTSYNVDVKVASRTPQFWIMFTGFGLSITGSYGVLSAGKTMLSDTFGTSMPALVTATFAAGFVSAISMSNLGGRVLWSNLSDASVRRLRSPVYGRKLAFSAMWALGPPSYLLAVWSVHQAAKSPDSILPLIVFCGSVFGIVSVFGGTAATRPALVADMFGSKNVTALTARQLTVVMPAAYVGPKLTAYFREQSIHSACVDLSSKVDAAHFERAFGAPHEKLPELLDAKTVTINRLMELVPAGTIDPTPYVYDKTLYVCAGLQSVAFLTNQLLKPIPPEKWMKEEDIVEGVEVGKEEEERREEEKEKEKK
jgi:MFS family permease